MFQKILIANRGEIACRIARTARRMGVDVATVHSDADAQALHVREIGESVRLGPAPARESYLDIAAVIRAARLTGCDAVHPGFGFLSENAAFARACAEAGLRFIGPSADCLVLFGDKAAAKRLARQLGIATAGGLDEPSDDPEQLITALQDLPLPFILKAVAGGGGKGMRVVRERGELRASIEAAIREGRSAFGDGRLIGERYLEAPRHIEVQVLGDGQGHAIHLHDRECSLQRRYQKVVEEAPVQSLAPALRAQVEAHALALARESRYLGLGTVEFAVTGSGDAAQAVFLEVNPRLQVEHPVTECVTGLDLVRLQIETVARGCLPLSQAEVPAPRGAAVQARLYAEDARRGFLPASGRIAAFAVPDTVRCDSGVDSGSTITPHYDPMIAKLIAHGPTREDALATLGEALLRTEVMGLTSNRGFLVALLARDEVRRNDVSTEFIDQWLASQPPQAQDTREVAALAALWFAARRAQGVQGAPSAGGTWGDPSLTGWRRRHGGDAQDAPAHTWVATGAHAHWRIGFARAGQEAGTFQVRVDDRLHRVQLGGLGEVAGVGSNSHTLEVDGTRLTLRALCTAGAAHAMRGAMDLSLEFAPLHGASGATAHAGQGSVRAPMMGILVSVNAAPGQTVKAGDRLATLESMKMEIAISAPVDGTVTWLGCAAQDKVERHQELLRIGTPT